MSFDEEHLKLQLASLSRQLRSAFAASVAQRLLPAYTRLNFRNKPDLATALAALWGELETHNAPVSSWDERIHLCENALPPDDEIPDWTRAHGHASDAAAAIEYALRSWRDNSIQAAAWCARSAVDALDRTGLPEGLSFSDPKEPENRAVQAEVRRQSRDLELLNQPSTEDTQNLVNRLRATSVAEAADVQQSLS